MEERAQHLGALAALAEELASVPSTHAMVHNHLQVQFQETQSPLVIPHAPGMYVEHIHTGRENRLPIKF